jgi:ATP phosphoribosyltransferase regulatory subunit
MNLQDRWLLPEGIEELLPPETARLEVLRRQIFDRFRTWGYELVVPPFIEYLESLLTGMGHDLDLQTFKLTDQLTGRMMGVRADITPQVARIDAHRLQRDTPTRLCYLGTVLHTRPTTQGGSRSPLQVGAEIYGHAGIDSDVEIMCLMLETLSCTGHEPITLDIGHMGIFRGLAAMARLDADQENDLFALLQRKALPELEQTLKGWQLRPAVRRMLLALTDLNGGMEVLDSAETALGPATRPVKAALAELGRIAAQIRQRAPSARLHFDLTELRGYHYHTGVMFAAYRQGHGQALAWGGRYDDVGRVFGRARPATGFSTDLLRLVRDSDIPLPPRRAIYAPHADDRKLRAMIERLRGRGECVICALPGARETARTLGCDRRVVRRNGRWQVVKA